MIKKFSELDPRVYEFLAALASEEMNAVRASETTRRCGACHTLLSTTDNTFHRDNRDPSGWFWMCKDCRKQKRKEQA